MNHFAPKISFKLATWSWFFFAALVVFGDLIIRHEIVLAWSHKEKFRHFGIYRNKIKFLYHADKNRWEAFDTTKDPEDTIDVIDLHRAELEAIMPIIRLNPTFRKLLERG